MLFSPYLKQLFSAKVIFQTTDSKEHKVQLNMEIFIGYCLTILEMTFILTGLLILHSLRRVLGTAPFYISIGILLLFSHLTGGAELTYTMGYTGLDYPLSSAIVAIPFLAMLIVVYVTDGTLVAQRIIIGTMAALGISVYLLSITGMQCTWPGYSLSTKPGAEAFPFLLDTSIHMMAAFIVALSVDLFLIPIFFQRLTNMKCSLFVTVLGSLLGVQLIDHLVFVTTAYMGTGEWWNALTTSYLSRALFVFILSIPTTIYLSRIQHETPGESRRTLDIILAFFGAYGKSLKLEQNLRETQERYRLLVQNASDMIVILNPEGIVIDANHAALRLLRIKTFSDIIGKPLNEVTELQPTLWLPLCQQSGPEIHSISSQIQLTGDNTVIELSITLSPFENSFMLIMFGRDITERRKLEKEREQWNIQTAHLQRLEAIGRLAGGIAHDFNNYIHAIQGHLDIILLMHDVQDEAVRRNLEKIDHITELAGTLTQQMLGFARKGNYQQTEVHLNALASKCAELFLPSTQSGIVFHLNKAENDPVVMGDPI